MRNHSPIRYALLAACLLQLAPAVCPAQFLRATAIMSGGAPAATTGDAERRQAAIDLAIMAADCGLMDVSVEAMRRACRHGPPVASVQLSGILGSAHQHQSPRNTNQQQQQSASARVEFAKRLCRLHEVWAEQKASPVLAYRAWKSLVLPTDRPNEAFAYPTSYENRTSVSYGNITLNAQEPTATPCGAEALVYWAEQADQVEDLRSTIAARQSLPGATTTVQLLKMILALDETTQPSEARALCRELAGHASVLVGAPESELLLGRAWKLIQRVGEDSEEGEQLTDALVGAIPSTENWRADPWLQFLSTRALVRAIDGGDVERFQTAARRALSQYDRIRVNNASYVARQEADLYTKAASRAFDAGHLKLGAACLKFRSLLPNGGQYGGPDWRALVDPEHQLMQSLLKMPLQERHEVLWELAWNSPRLGIEKSIRLTPTDDVPPLFTKDLAGGPPSLQVASGGDRCYSLLGWAMRDAIALGRSHEIETRIEKLEQAGNDDAPIARLVFQLAKDEPIDLAQLQHADGSLTPVLGKGALVSPLELAIARQALSSEPFVDAGRAFIENRINTAAARTQWDLRTSLLQVRHEHEAATNGRREHSSLLHWCVSDDVGRLSLLIGKPAASVWVERGPGAWGHEFGPEMSNLLLRYPLEGDYSVSFRAKDGFFGESGVISEGLFFELMQDSSVLWLWGVSNRGRTDVKTTAMKNDVFNSLRVDCSERGVRLHVNDEAPLTLGGRSGAFPFFGFSSFTFRPTTVDSVRIEGDPTIPRHVEMASPLMLGWSTRFTGGTLVDLTVGESIELPKVNSASTTRPDWRCADGEIASVDHVRAAAEREEKHEETRRESLLQYLRPLGDNEQVSLEFYYEPGKFSLAPAVGRIAMNLDHSAPRLHWVTCENEPWTGVPADNLVADPTAETANPISLKPGDWNQLTVRWEGETVILNVNGDEVYRREWEPEAGRMFGLFHDPTQHHVRVRNVRLSGDWPETLPEDLFETHPTNET